MNATDVSRFVGLPLGVATRAVFAVLGCLVCALGVAGNLTLLSVLTKYRSATQHLQTVYIVNLSLSDLIIEGYFVPFWIFDLILGYHPLFGSGYTHCVVNGWLSCTCYTVSVLLLLLISANRYVCICHPSLFQRLFGPRLNVLQCCVVWLISALLTLPPVFGVGPYAYDVQVHLCAYDRSRLLTYMNIYAAVFIPMPTIGVGVFNLAIYRRWKRSARRIGQWSVNPVKPVNPLAHAATCTVRIEGRQRQDSDAAVSSASVDPENHEEETVDGTQEAQVSPRPVRGGDLNGGETGRDDLKNTIPSKSGAVLTKEYENTLRKALAVDDLEDDEQDKIHDGTHYARVKNDANHDVREAGSSSAIQKQFVWTKGNFLRVSGRKKETIKEISHQRSMKHSLSVPEMLINRQTKSGTMNRNAIQNEAEDKSQSRETGSSASCASASTDDASTSGVALIRGAAPLVKASSLATSSSDSISAPHDTSAQMGRQNRRVKASDIALVRSLLAVWVCLLVLNTPFLVASYVCVFTGGSAEIFLAMNWLVFLNNSLNWMLYGALNKTFRMAFQKLFSDSCCRWRARQNGRG